MVSRHKLKYDELTQWIAYRGAIAKAPHPPEDLLNRNPALIPSTSGRRRAKRRLAHAKYRRAALGGGIAGRRSHHPSDYRVAATRRKGKTSVVSKLSSQVSVVDAHVPCEPCVEDSCCLSSHVFCRSAGCDSAPICLAQEATVPLRSAAAAIE